jgi:hydroxyethylthiazole kinase-like uncharacterized protein yjeF
MQSLFFEVDTLDKRCYNDFGLNEDILMEHAANGMKTYIERHFAPRSSLLIISGSGNNGADGVALARLLHANYDVRLYLASPVKSPLGKQQVFRAKAIGVPFVQQLDNADVIVDALFGSGLNKPLSSKYEHIIQKLNHLQGHKIACDIPSGLNKNGQVQPITFQANVTLTMGALKRGLFSDHAKEVIGAVEVIDLGVARSIYETSSNWNLLDSSDLTLPFRQAHNTHKGSFGHLAILSGEKVGASTLAGKSALRFGAGLVTLISHEKLLLEELMVASSLPHNTTAITAGMGLGNHFTDEEIDTYLVNSNVPLVIDADLFSDPIITTLVKRENVVLTPHPKEFVSLLYRLNLANIDIQTLQENRFTYVEMFAKAYPDVTLLLKGANPIITQNNTFYINPHGSAILSKGGSGDVLAGMIGALLAQGVTPLQAAIQASLAHTLAAQQLDQNNYSLIPQDLIEALKTI